MSTLAFPKIKTFTLNNLKDIINVHARKETCIFRISE